MRTWGNRGGKGGDGGSRGGGGGRGGMSERDADEYVVSMPGSAVMKGLASLTAMATVAMGTIY